MNIIKRLLREPLVHFFVVGSLVFGIFEFTNTTDKVLPRNIMISAQRIDQLSASFRSVWNRLPNQDELNSLIKAEIREEVYYRDALVLGLDKNDAIVRRRLRQKMEFLMDVGSSLKKPAAGELEAYYEANTEAYQSAALIGFEQVFLGDKPTRQEISGLLSRLRAADAVDFRALGKRTMLPGSLRASHAKAIDASFGQGFFAKLAKINLETWTGPVSSAFGLHLVRIVTRTKASVPPLEKVREAVLRDWQAAKAAEFREADYARRRARFEVEVARKGTKAAKK